MIHFFRIYRYLAIKKKSVPLRIWPVKRLISAFPALEILNLSGMKEPRIGAFHSYPFIYEPVGYNLKSFFAPTNITASELLWTLNACHTLQSLRLESILIDDIAVGYLHNHGPRVRLGKELKNLTIHIYEQTGFMHPHENNDELIILFMKVAFSYVERLQIRFSFESTTSTMAEKLIGTFLKICPLLTRVEVINEIRSSKPFPAMQITRITVPTETLDQSSVQVMIMFCCSEIEFIYDRKKSSQDMDQLLINLDI